MIDVDNPQTKSTEKQIKELQKVNEQLNEENQMLTDCLLEMSQVVYGGGE